MYYIVLFLGEMRNPCPRRPGPCADRHVRLPDDLLHASRVLDLCHRSAAPSDAQPASGACVLARRPRARAGLVEPPHPPAAFQADTRASIPTTTASHHRAPTAPVASGAFRYRPGGVARAHQVDSRPAASAMAPSPRQTAIMSMANLCPIAVARLSGRCPPLSGLRGPVPQPTALAARLQPRYNRPPRNPYRLDDGLTCPPVGSVRAAG